MLPEKYWNLPRGDPHCLNSTITPFLHHDRALKGLHSCYNIAMAPERPAEIERAQGRTHYPIDGEFFARIRYGDESFDWRADTRPCHDCGVIKGQLHVPCCDVEECPKWHTQALSCDCDLGDA